MKSHRAFKKIKGGNFWYLRYNQHSVHVVFVLIKNHLAFVYLSGFSILFC